MAENEATLSGLIASILRGSVEGLRKNKIAAVFSLIVLVASTVFAVNTSHYDERQRYRQVLLPEIAQSEARFLSVLQDAEATNNEDWRIFYFVSAHLKARDTLELVRRRWPHTPEGIRAHNELVQYYELVTEDFAIIRTQMSLDEKMDFIAAWKKVQAERWPVHEKWMKWVNGR